jgi:septal ring factor EnvC (AmiA/AmiB activator)
LRVAEYTSVGGFSHQKTLYLCGLITSCAPLLLQDPAKARLREETSRLNRKIAAGNAEVEALKRRAKAQAKTLAKLKKDLQALQDSRVSVVYICRAALTCGG